MLPTLLLSLLPQTSASATPGDAWPGWRGPNAGGVAQGSPPLTWSEKENVRWKTPIPGKGLSCPVIWGERVFLTSAVPTGKAFEGTPAGTTRRSPPEVYAPIEEQEFVVLALERKSGAVQWKKSVLTAMPHQTTHPDGSYASPTPVTDGTHLFVSFGSYGVYALTLAGEVVWQKDLGDLLIEEEFGEGSSPVLAGELLVLNWDHEGDSFLLALDKATGAERWRTPRPKGTSWTTPLVVRAGDALEIVVAGVRTIAYDAASGRELWSYGPADKGGGMLMSSPVQSDELVLCSGGGRAGEVRGLVALPAADAGPDAEPLLWSTRTAAPGIPSPIVYEGVLYFLEGNSGILDGLDPTSGERRYGPERLKEVADVYASPVAAGGHLYVAGREGKVEVLATRPKLETVAVNTLEDGFDSSPAIAGDELFLRGRASLYCIAKQP